MRKKFTRSCKSNKTITTGKQGTGMSSNLSLWRQFLWKRKNSPIVRKIIKISSRKSEIALGTHHARPATELVNKTHQEGSPWYMVITKKERKNNIISKESLQKFYQSQKPLETIILPAFIYENLEPVKRNENGVLVLSSDDWEGENA